MKLKIFLMSAFMLILLSLQVNSESASNPPLPPFWVHVQPGTCNGSGVSGAKVKITYDGGEQTGTTNSTGWVYLTAGGTSVYVEVTLPWDECQGYGDYETQTQEGNHDVQVCLVSWCR